jgi:hemoglobin/transferrin/lactoferrin receptor protein
MFSTAGMTQTADTNVVSRASEQKKQKQSKRRPAQQAQAPVLDARAQVGGTPVQSLDTITVAASKTEERAIDALAPVSVVTLEQIQGLQPNRLSDILYSVPGVSVQERGDDPATVINIRGLQDFGRVAVIVDGARQNYQHTGHNANGSFFLDPELIGGVDVVRGPTANIYGSGAIGGVVSFRTKDINDVLRPGERWGVDMTGSYGSNTDRGLGSVFGGVRADPNVDIFGGAVYRTQGNYKDGNGTEIGNTGNEIAGGLMKLTVRPAEGHEIKFGGVFQDYQYGIGQFNRGPVLTPAQRALYQGSSVYASDAKNYTGTITWSTPSRTTCGSTGTPRSTATALTTIRPRPIITAPPVRSFAVPAVPATTSPAASATSAAICSIPSASTSTIRRASTSATGVTR